MKNVDDKMKSLISDYTILSYLHDLLSYSKNHGDFYESETYIELHENDVLTSLKYLWRLIFTIVSFTGVILILKSLVIPIYFLHVIAFPVSLIYGVLIVKSKNDIKDLTYQLKTKQAAQFALEHYTYDQFVVFLDKYLSELSSMSYTKQLTGKNYK